MSCLWFMLRCVPREPRGAFFFFFFYPLGPDVVSLPAFHLSVACSLIHEGLLWGFV